MVCVTSHTVSFHFKGFHDFSWFNHPQILKKIKSAVLINILNKQKDISFRNLMIFFSLISKMFQSCLMKDGPVTSVVTIRYVDILKDFQEDSNFCNGNKL